MEITIGKMYTVFAISKYFDILFYYILSDESNEYPLAYPYYLFEIFDRKISKTWEPSHIKSKSIDTIDIKNGDVISFKEWSFKGERFYENLLEGNREEVILFKKYRDDILME
ncbi:hypothetical protein GEO21_19920 [Sphingobacterium faecium]|uniref:hypothetical protein n=1 Tax=Sphingobacterium faecium TaxID=34087 RepID=UPI001290FECF|nr:hypothetical protein [Sphingobacterium faecium]MQP29758.1 hypothetical protein [Sphingobacterium faecium]